MSSISSFLDQDYFTLQNRKKGELFCVKHKNNNDYIAQMSFIESLHYKISSSHRREVATKLKGRIDHLTKELEYQEDKNKFIKTLFFEKMAPLSRNIYSRQLHESTAKFLSAELDHEEQINRKGHEVSDNYKTKFKIALLWARLGNFENVQAYGGGSYKIKDGEGTALGIFKPEIEDGLTFKNPSLLAKIRSIAYRCLYPITKLSYSCKSGQGYTAEVIARRISNWVMKCTESGGHEIVPDTQVASIQLGLKNPMKGSFQLWENDSQVAEESLSIGHRYNSTKMPSLDAIRQTLPSEQFDLLVIIDFITGNFDRHASNWLIRNQKVFAIDGGFAMAPAHPKWWNFIELRNQYLWKRLPLAGETFTENGKAIIENLYQNREEIKKEIEAFYSQELPGKANENVNRARVNCMMERIEVLYKMREATKREVAEVRTESQIKKLFPQRN